ncbi:hypothetical protein CXR04_26520 [Streptomyces sp. CMB-StM0423]|nr:hypothetical protein CXR04_26520 [Streptomyces sp. CMB-StM0423]
MWGLLGAIASVLSILAWLGVSNPEELKELLDDPPSSPPPAVDIPGSGAAGVDDPEPEPDPSTPAPDPSEEAFQAVSVGDCLAVFDTGRGDGTIEWSAEVPPDPVSCASKQAVVQVTGTNTDCPTSYGKSFWSYRSGVSDNTTRLCLSRIFHADYCLLGRQSGDSISLGVMTAVPCRREPVPAAYNQIMHITGVYRAPAGATADNCRRVAGDQTRYWSWLVDDGAILLCTTIYQGS